MASFIHLDGYSALYEPNNNKITILLPQTVSTVRSTVQPISSRKTDITDDDLFLLLEMAMYILRY